MRSQSTAFVATQGARLARHLYPDMLWQVDTDAPTVYLTFDDGPTPSVTDRIADLLASFQATATFFMIGQHARRYPQLVRTLHQAGHTIGNHTFTHPSAWDTAFSDVMRELDRTTHLLEDLVQQRVRWMRPPYGRFTYPLRQWCIHRRQRMVMWDVMPADFIPGVTSDQLVDRVVNQVRPGSVVVLHDNPKTGHATLQALEQILIRLSEQGYSFSALAR